MVGCYFSKWLECFPIPVQKATTVARKLVYEIVAQYGAKGGAGGVSAVRNTQDEDNIVPPAERWVHRTKFQEAGLVPESCLLRDEAGVGRARATHPDELPGCASGQHKGDPHHDDARPADTTFGPGQVRNAPGAGRGREDGERVCGRTPGGAVGSVPARP